jgi:hypothetical protein
MEPFVPQYAKAQEYYCSPDCVQVGEAVYPLTWSGPFRVLACLDSSLGPKTQTFRISRQQLRSALPLHLFMQVLLNMQAALRMLLSTAADRRHLND